ncbi:MAG: tetratricopeptide repeat protein [Chloroflexota bacterium]
MAASGDRDGARRAADEARAVTPPDDHDALFGVGRAYAAAGAWDDAIAAWSDVGAGPQLLRLGRDLARGPDWQASISAFVAASRLGAPGRSGPDGAATTALAHGQSAEEAIAHLAPLIASGGTVGYRARLESARVYRLTGQPERAQQALLEAERAGPDDQLELERALINLDLNQPYASEAALVWIVAHPIEPADGIPDGDDPRYWLAVAQARVGKPDDALATARAGLAALSPQQASLRVPYHLLIGDTLLSLGRPVDAMTTFRAGQRLAPTDPRLADGVARAQAALRR